MDAAAPVPKPKARKIPSQSPVTIEQAPSTTAATPAVVPSQPAGGEIASTADKSEIDRQIMAAVEEVLMRNGNPHYAEIITNDPVTAKELRRRLNAVEDGGKLRAEIEKLEARRAELIVENKRREEEMSKARLDIGRLHRLINHTVKNLVETQRMIERGEAESKPGENKK
jgi:hypothetical protein